MKQLSLITAVLLNSMGVLLVLTAGSAIILLQMGVNQIAVFQKEWKIKKMNKEMENNYWLIE